ncbi:MAG: hypothetical protein M0P09_08035, partial [Acholeplasmataceae bacterium]|nr:hypothetical protein [Acholeplasmataceae bacterium]
FNIFANIAVILGIGFAASQYSAIKENNYRIFAIDALNRFYNKEFYQSTAIVHTKEFDRNSIEYIDASNYLFNTYYLIAVVYENKIADNELISNGIKYELKRYVCTESFKNQPNKDVSALIKSMNSSINKNNTKNENNNNNSKCSTL